VREQPFDLMAKLEELAAEGRLTERGKPLRTLKAAPAGRRVPTVGTETEEKFQQRVIDLAHARGWRVAHFRPVRVQRKDGSVYYCTPVGADGEGFPDLELVRERIVKAELKSASEKRRKAPGREKGLKPAQQEWRDAYIRAGVEWYVWSPDDWPEIERVLQ